MIKFFRRIRQQLLNEGKTGRYFKYAFGEIILVVLGILIALQINNWNERRMSKAMEELLYDQILKELKLELADLESRKDMTSLHVDYFTKVSEKKYEEINLVLLTQYLGISFDFHNRNNGFNSLIQHSNSNEIFIKDLFNTIRLHYEEQYQRVNQFSKWHIAFTNGTVEDYISKNLSVDIAFKGNEKEILHALEDDQLMFIVNYQLASNNATGSALDILINNTENLISKISEQLDKSDD
ncbi:MAG: hypothetical protein BM563_10335 [Bacteroidetes bacterium MedPE-SWsnd-G1]|nr:MAG: hypothetical protein BM563_10335 [Bacteroidetes bacterium MedPE-SWsnd-G1]